MKSEGNPYPDHQYGMQQLWEAGYAAATAQHEARADILDPANAEGHAKTLLAWAEIYGAECSCGECTHCAHYLPALQAGAVALAENVRLREALIDMAQRKDGAYLERNKLVALLCSIFPSVKTKTAIKGWSEDWHGCVYIYLPTGQVSWHFHNSQADLFKHVPSGPVEWDGHSTNEKYERVMNAAQMRYAGEGV